MELTNGRVYYDVKYITKKHASEQSKVLLADTEEQAINLLRYSVADWDCDEVTEIISILRIEK